MRIFPHTNKTNGFTCPVCRTDWDRPVVLTPIPGTEKGNIVEARQVHADCYRWLCMINGYKCDIEE